MESTGDEVVVSGNLRGLTEKLTFELRSEGDKGLSHVSIWGQSAPVVEIANAKALWQVQGARRRPVGWSPESKGASSRKRAQRGDQGRLWGFMDCGGTLSFPLSDMVPWESAEQGRDVTGPDVHRHPLQHAGTGEGGNTGRSMLPRCGCRQRRVDETRVAA